MTFHSSFYNLIKIPNVGSLTSLVKHLLNKFSTDLLLSSCFFKSGSLFLSVVYAADNLVLLQGDGVQKACLTERTYSGCVRS